MDENQKREEFARCWLNAEPSISAYVFAAIRRFHDAEDVVQKIAQELAKRFDEYDSNRPFVGWALWIAKSRVIDFYRSQGRNQLVFSNELLQSLGKTISQRSEGRDQRREALEICLDGLPKRSRKLIDKRYVEEQSAAEMADSLDSTAGSIRVLLSRTRTALAECVERRLNMEGS
ncbi:MAG: sigma-70 family RNA polymerase sigma factor [Planctomycetota bacterium]